MTDAEKLEKELDSSVEYRSNKDKGKFGIFYKGNRFAYTSYEYVEYTSRERAYQAMVQHGILRGLFLHRQGSYDNGRYRAAVDELLMSGKLEIREL